MGKNFSNKNWKFLHEWIFNKKNLKPRNTIELAYDVALNYQFKRENDKNGNIVYHLKNSEPLIIKLTTDWNEPANANSEFDNSGNARLWLSEEIMSNYCILKKDFFKDKSICELGAGMTGLSSLMLAIHSSPKYVLITDGNEKCISSNILTLLVYMQEILDIKKNIYENKHFENQIISVLHLHWQKIQVNSILYHSFDIIMSADCLFFKNYHENLINCLDSLLDINGIAIILAPLRDNSLDIFIDKIKTFNGNKNIFFIYKTVQYEPLSMIPDVDKKLNFEDKYPYMLLLARKKKCILKFLGFKFNAQSFH
ncbi:hypothetical protein A3Q56_00587 [Intoshia linei]|uniref:Calmodulin-lysine N-methyltransferase n=1 Tax=Intoshia linei TaxID=1819745 RepID=A0A177BD47_9BILA|nr:hypothetical protein A3Q56_00587 [Intoshia linei]